MKANMKKVIASPNAPKAVGPYSQAINLNGTVFVSGQLPVNPADGSVPQTIEEQTRQSLKNIGEILKEAGYSYDDVVKTTVLLDDIGNLVHHFIDLIGMNKVNNSGNLTFG